MSDKFFFKGRQDARQDYAGGSYQAKVGNTAGSEKYPLELVVTSAARQAEVQTLVDDAKLHAHITVDTSDDAEESIKELTALLNKGPTVTVEKTPARNEPCSCGSGKKYKKCCG
ncbi:PBPRA1643 family SWIM/SEC-C metal-binding motif protein [Congregibacter sp.]|uniref:PBPRA1643 family SWIM/SEC-C metal-binding motif protein n=1 Tax=Congregibacter sp. TaxID=2744308 RepID=UPI003858C9BA